MLKSISPSSVVKASSGQISTDLGGEVVILTLESGRYYSLNEVGTRIWELIQEPKPVDSIIVSLLEEYDVDSELCESDVFAILKELASEGLLDID